MLVPLMHQRQNLNFDVGDKTVVCSKPLLIKEVRLNFKDAILGWLDV